MSQGDKVIRYLAPAISFCHIWYKASRRLAVDPRFYLPPKIPTCLIPLGWKPLKTWTKNRQTRHSHAHASLTTISVAKYIQDQKDCASWILYIISTQPSRLMTCQSTHSTGERSTCKVYVRHNEILSKRNTNHNPNPTAPEPEAV